MQYFKKDMKKKYYFKIKNFRLPRGQPPETFNLPPANSTRGGQVGNCLFLTLHDVEGTGQHFGVKVKDQILNFLVNASSPKAFDVVTSNSVGA